MLLDAYPLAWEQALSEVDRADAEVVAIFKAMNAPRFEEAMAALDAQARLREAARPRTIGDAGVSHVEIVRQLLSTHPKAAHGVDRDGVFALTLAARYKSSAAVLKLLLDACPPAWEHALSEVDRADAEALASCIFCMQYGTGNSCILKAYTISSCVVDLHPSGAHDIVQ